jgi:isopentenyl-diphosphate delta-isomerase
MKNRNKVVLVDPQDVAIGEMDKMEAHEKGVLHRAFSIFLFNEKQEMLIHQRAKEKYHGAGLWTNTCCSHPQLHDDLKESALERLNFEMGIECAINEVFSFTYNIQLENDLIEHEFDHVFIGHTEKQPNPNPAEVQDYKWISIPALQKEIDVNPQRYTYWFKTVLSRVVDFIKA